jgi:cytochrome c peroxidase
MLKAWKTSDVLLAWLLGAVACLIACSQDDIEPAPLDERFQFKVPEFFPEPTYTFRNNPVTEPGFELGRKLFFDPILSRDSTISCSSCHSQSVAFADAQHRLSIGIDDRVGTRNAPSISNLAFQDRFFWDGGVTHVDFIPVNAIENEFEMDNNIATIVERIRNHEEYPQMFDQAFGGDTINSGRMLHALSQFMVMMISANSDYDKYLRNENVELREAAISGLNTFEQNCSSCHQGIMFTSGGFENNGLDEIYDKDIGRALITENDLDLGKFRVPSLRNVALTAPYMHDGRLSTLMDVLDHYSDGVKDSPTLSPQLRQGDQLGIPLTMEEKQNLVAFLETLSDWEFINDTRFFGSR